MKYRKKPVVVEAFQMTKELWECRMPVHPGWFEEALKNRIAIEDLGNENWGVIKTLEGNHIVSWGDWIIKGVKGELYPCKPEIFEMTYEEYKEEDDLIMQEHGDDDDDFLEGNDDDLFPDSKYGLFQEDE